MVSMNILRCPRAKITQQSHNFKPMCIVPHFLAPVWIANAQYTAMTHVSILSKKSSLCRKPPSLQEYLVDLRVSMMMH